MTKHGTTRKALGALILLALTGLAFFFAARSTEATTNPVEYGLVVIVPSHGTITVDPRGNTAEGECDNECEGEGESESPCEVRPCRSNIPTYTYDPNAQVTLSVSNIDTGYRFTGWTIEKFGNPSTFTYPTGTQTTITMDANYQASANFVQQFTLTTSVGSGNGSIAANPTSSPSSPAGTYDSGAAVTLTFNPDPGWRFDHWTRGIVNMSTNPTTVTMDANKSYAAHFVQQYNLTTSVTGNGSVSPAAGPYDSGAVLTVTATPATGWRFGSWSGDLTGSANPASLTMSAAKNVTATFVQQFTITKSAAGTGCSILADPAQNPPSSPAGTYDTGSTVTLTPQANSTAGWRFARWTTDGAWGGYANPLVFNNIISNHSVIGYFAIEVTLSTAVSPAGSGTVTANVPNSWNWPTGLYGKGVGLTLTANADPGYCFSHWEGGYTGTANPTTGYTVDFPTVTAVFVPKYTLTVSAIGGGTVTPASGLHCPGSAVSITATPDTANGWRFLRWVGDTAGMADPANASNTVTMDADKRIGAVFAPSPLYLVADFAAMLTYFYGVGYDPDFDFIFPPDMDSSGMYDRNGWADGEPFGTYSANGILDGAELALVEHVLENSADPHYEAVKTAWELNYAAIHERLMAIQAAYPGYVMPDDGYVQVWAAYGAIDAGSQELVSSYLGACNFLQNVNADTGMALAVAAAPLDADADYDADGKTNLVEWTAYHNGGGDFVTNPQQWITEEPTLVLDTSVEGDGAIAVAPIGPKYMPGAQVTLAATPGTDWVLERWWGNVADAWSSPETTILMDNSHVVAGQFVHRPGMATLNLWEDFAAFLVLVGAPETIVTFDRNKTRYDMQGGFHTSPNGIPDAAELYLLERTIKDLRLDLSPWDGAVSDYAWEDWEANLARAQQDLAGLDGAAVRIVAAYMTLGDYDSTEIIMQLVHSTWPAYTLDRQNYKRNQQRFLKSSSDADNDGLSNIEEWQAVSTGNFTQDRDTYVEAALNRELPGESRQSPPPQPVPGGDCSCRPSGTIATNVIWVPWEDDYICPGGSHVDPLGTVPMWTSVKANATANRTFQFVHWNAPGAMLDYSRLQSEKFRFAMSTEEAYPALANSILIVPGFVRNKMQIADPTPLVRIEVEPGRDAELEYDSEGHLFVVGPPNSWAKLKAVALDDDYYVEKIQITSALGSEDPRFAWGPEARPYVGGFAFAVMRERSYVPPDTQELGSGSDKGGQVYVNGAYQWPGTFLGPIRVGGFPRNLTARPYPGYRFVCWRPHPPELPEVSPLRTQETINLSQSENNAMFHAVFTPEREYTLDLEVSVEGGGTDECAGYVNAWPAKKYYREGETVKVKATANYTPGANCAYAFLRWEGDALGSSFPMPSPMPVNQVFSNEITLSMTANTTIRAVFLNLAALDAGFGEQVVHIKQHSWATGTGYGGDVFDHQVTDSGELPGWNWEGVTVQESMYHLRDDFGLQGIDFHGGAASEAGTWRIRSAGTRVGQMNCYANPGSGFWRDTADPNKEENFVDRHNLSAAEGIHSEFKTYFDNNPSSVGYLEAVQVMRVSNVGPNNPQSPGAFGRLYAAHRVSFRFVAIQAGCYSNDGDPSFVAHCLVRKGGQNHPCAYDGIPNVFPPQFDINDPDCYHMKGCRQCP